MANRLIERRESRGLKNSQVALYLDISTAHVSDIESGKRKPSLDLLARLAGFYRCTTDYLLGLAQDPSGYAPAPGLPTFGREVLEVMERLSDGRREELHAHALVLEEAEHRERNERRMAAALDQAEALGEDVLDALLTALDLLNSSGRPAAEEFIRAFWAKQAKEWGEEKVHDG